MNEINALDLKGFVTNAINEVFDTMLSMDVEIFDPDSKLIVDSKRIVGSVGFAGEVMGSIAIQVSDDFARLMTAAMLGMELEEIEGEEDVHDVIGEMSNMIGGDLKSRLCDAGFPCSLSIPSITSGTDFKIESMDGERHKCFAFKHEQHTAIVEVVIKSGD
jgi:CheY-specific phosphatase CheX